MKKIQYAVTKAENVVKCVSVFVMVLASPLASCTVDDPEPDPMVSVTVLPPPPMEDPVTVDFGICGKDICDDITSHVEDNK